MSKNLNWEISKLRAKASSPKITNTLGRNPSFITAEKALYPPYSLCDCCWIDQVPCFDGTQLLWKERRRKNHVAELSTPL